MSQHHFFYLGSYMSREEDSVSMMSWMLYHSSAVKVLNYSKIKFKSKTNTIQMLKNRKIDDPIGAAGIKYYSLIILKHHRRNN